MSVARGLILLAGLNLLAHVSALNPPFVDCDASSNSSTNPFRTCCEHEELPNGCECFDVMKDTDFTNTLFFKPKCPSEAEVSFHFYDQANSNGTGIRIRGGANNNIASTPFDKNRKTAFFTHGWLMSYQDIPVIMVKDALLAMEDMNVILVDWSVGASGPGYEDSVPNTRVAGAMIARLVQDLSTVGGQSLKDIHLLGFSMGTQVSGVAGKEIERLTGQKVGRISAMDPPGRQWEFASPNVRLDKSDALFVDCIHTDAYPDLSLALGQRSAHCHVDFYMNGAHLQPGCLGHPDTEVLDITIPNLIYGAAVCSHAKAIEFYLFSMSTCDYEPDTEDGAKCKVGYHVDQSCRGSYNVTTLVPSPYC